MNKVNEMDNNSQKFVELVKKSGYKLAEIMEDVLNGEVSMNESAILAMTRTGTDKTKMLKLVNLIVMISKSLSTYEAIYDKVTVNKDSNTASENRTDTHLKVVSIYRRVITLQGELGLETSELTALVGSILDGEIDAGTETSSESAS